MSSSSGTAGVAERKECACQCLPHLPVFREDLHICIDDIQGKIIYPYTRVTVVPRVCACMYIQSVPGGMDKTSRECSLC